jgi:ATP-dependent protease ClpP protease subunit
MPKLKNKFFNSATENDTLTMSFYDMIGASMWDDSGATPALVAEALKTQCQNIEIHINSPGGDAFAGIAIYNLLKNSNKPVNVIIDGMAASAASIVAMAGDTIVMATGSVMMIHEAMAMAFGNSDAMTKMAETLTTVTSGIADIYVAKTGLAKKDVLKMQNVETWMTAEDAVAKGFATSVSADQAAVENSFDLKAFRNAPASLKPQAKAEEVSEPVEEPVEEKPVVIDVTTVADEEPQFITVAAKDLISLYTHQLEVNKRK